jgi:hypothetical protein
MSVHYPHINSIPLERRDGTTKYSECNMYNRNYTEISNLWMDKNPNEILINHKHLLDEMKNYEIINCKHGWTYDTSIFPMTVISEV